MDSVATLGPAVEAAHGIRRRLLWQRVPVERMRILQPRRETVFLLGFAVAFIAASWVTGLLIRHHPWPILGASYFTSDLQYVVLFKFAGLLLVPGLWFYAGGYKAADLLPEWRLTPWRGVMAVAAFAAGVFLNLGHLPGIFIAANNFTRGQLALRLAMATLIPLVTAAVAEEFVYRGLLQTRLEAVLGRSAAILLTSVLFTAWHLPSRFWLASGVEGQAGNAVSVLLNTGVPVLILALVFSALWDRYRGLVGLIALHFGIDLLPAISSLLMVPLAGPVHH